MPEQNAPSTESMINTDPQLAQAVSNAMTSELFGDIKILQSEVDRLSVSINALAPAAEDVDKKWLSSRKQALSAEFQAMVKEILHDEVKLSSAKTNLQLARAADYLSMAKTQLEAVFLKMLLMATLLGVLVGVSSVIITVYLIKLY